jgi:hypothetical protein
VDGTVKDLDMKSRTVEACECFAQSSLKREGRRRYREGDRHLRRTRML